MGQVVCEGKGHNIIVVAAQGLEFVVLFVITKGEHLIDCFLGVEDEGACACCSLKLE